MQDDFWLWLSFGGAFIAAAMIIALAGNALLKRQRTHAKLASNALTDSASAAPRGGLLQEWVAKLTTVDDRLLGFDDAGLKSKTRMELIRAGYFSPDAAKYFALARASLTIGAPLLGYVAVTPFLTTWDMNSQMVLLVFLMVVGYFGPEFYLKRCQSKLVKDYRNAFPDMLDLLVVCIDAGSSINAALDRVGHDIGFQSQSLAINIQLLVSEMRSGRSLVEALASFTRRVGLEEAGSLSTLVKQSVELGTDIGDALRTYSDEMRDKRLMRAETKAHALPAKMVVPLGVFIFPVIMIVIMTPAAINVMTSLGGGGNNPQ